MYPLFSDLVQGVNLRGSLPERVTAFLGRHRLTHTLSHSKAVVRVVGELALQFRINLRQSISAAWLHDVSAVLPDVLRVDTARQLGLDLLPEEEVNPVVVHQKLSRVMAQQIFKVDDPVILSAVECHTTLKAGAGIVDKILFVADKIAWDQPGIPPYLIEIREAAKISLDYASYVYLRKLWERQASLPGPLHPWALAALSELEQTIKNGN